jgi:GNAT superfamily N-acetyltransferase
MDKKQSIGFQIQEASSKEEFLKCREVISELRPGLSEDRYLTLMLYMLDEGYKLLYIEEEGRVLSVCGYRPMTLLSLGRTLMIDDLCTLPGFRRKGYGHALLHRVLADARADEIQSIHLFMPYQSHEGQRFLLQEGFLNQGHYLVKEC